MREKCPGVSPAARNEVRHFLPASREFPMAARYKARRFSPALPGFAGEPQGEFSRREKREPPEAAKPRAGTRPARVNVKFM